MLQLPPGNLTEFPGKFPEPVERHARKLILRDELFADRRAVEGFTIDSIDSPDLDDAIWMKEIENGWVIQVSISDVDALVKKDSYTDLEALSRTTSHYFPKTDRHPAKIIPMLPKILSENRLSLLEGKPRPTLTVEIHIDKNTRLRRVKVFKSYLRSAKRLGLREYGDQKIISDPGLPLRDYHNMAKLLNSNRWSQQSFALQELRAGLRTDEDGQIQEGSISASALIVQEFMVLANTAVAELLLDQRLPAPFRNHLQARQTNPTKQQIIDEIERNRDYLSVVDSIRAIYAKSLSAAVYEPNSLGHYGLGADTYLHFTSPIRRYADLVVHRVVKALLDGDEQPYSSKEMEQLCHHLNQRQRRLTTLRANLSGTNSFRNYQSNLHLLHAEKKQPDHLNILLDYLREQRIGNAFFEFTASSGVNIELSCKASIRFHKVLHSVTFTGRADKQTAKNQAALLLLKLLKKLVASHPSTSEEEKSISTIDLKKNYISGESVVYNLYDFCEDQKLARPTFHYEIWNGGPRPITCICRIDETRTVLGYGDSRIKAKRVAATKLLDYLMHQDRRVNLG